MSEGKFSVVCQCFDFMPAMERCPSQPTTIPHRKKRPFIERGMVVLSLSSVKNWAVLRRDLAKDARAEIVSLYTKQVFSPLFKPIQVYPLKFHGI